MAQLARGQPGQMRTPGTLGVHEGASAERLREGGAGALGCSRVANIAAARSPSSRASRSITVPPSSGASRSPGGKLGRPPSRSRRPIAGRACSVWPENQRAAPSSSQAQRSSAAKRAGREGPREIVVVLGDHPAGVERRRAQLRASHASPGHSTPARRAPRRSGRAAPRDPPSRRRSVATRARYSARSPAAAGWTWPAT